MIDNLTPITLDQLQVFVAVAEQGSFSGAARSLQRAQSAVSYGIAQLEQKLGLELFERTGHTPVLSASGHALLPQTRAILGQVSELQRRAQELVGGEEPRLSLVVDMIFPVEQLIKGLDYVHQNHPQVEIMLHTEALGAVSQRVLDGSCQLGITGLLLPLLPGDLVAQELLSLQLLMVVASHHPLAQWQGPVPLDELRKHTQLVLADRSDFTHQQEIGVLSDHTWRIAGLHTKYQLLKAGQGFGTLPEHMVADDLAQGRLVLLHPQSWRAPLRTIPLYVIYRASQPPGRVARLLIAEFSRLS